MATKVMRTISIHLQEGKDGIRWDRAPGEEASQTFYAGAPLVRDGTSAELEVWAGSTDASRLVGFAAHAASGTAGTKVGYYEASDTNIFEGSLINATAAYTLLGSEVGTSYSLVASGNDWYVDVADTATTLVTVVGLIDAVGDVNPRVKIKVIPAKQADSPITSG